MPWKGRPARNARAASAAVVAGAILAAAALLAGGALAVSRIAEASAPKVTERFSTYVEAMSPEAKLVVSGSRQRYAASKEFSAKLMALVRVNASVEISAWADVSYIVDFSDASKWKVGWDRRARVLTLEAPALDILPPSVRTETIEVRVKGSNLVTSTVFRLKEEAAKMRDGLSADFAVKARNALGDQAVRDAAREGLVKFGAAFCKAAYGVEPARVELRLAD